MMQLGLHLQNFEAEKQKLRTQVKRLCQENAWLRDELGSTQKKLHECEQTNASYAVEIEHLKFLKNIQQFDDTSGNAADAHHQQQDLVNDLFPFDDNEDDQQAENGKIFTSYNDLSMSTSHIASGSFLSSTGYEIPARLKTLHNLVIQYASQGRYEVAVPLCRQALADLEKSSGHQRKRNSKDVRLGILPGNFSEIDFCSLAVTREEKETDVVLLQALSWTVQGEIETCSFPSRIQAAERFECVMACL